MSEGKCITIEVWRRRLSLRGVVLGAVAVALAIALARPAPVMAFAESGALSALPSPFECVGETEQEPKAVCGTSVAGGLSNIFQPEVSPDGRNVYSVATNGDLIEYARNQASGALTVIGCIAASAGPKCAPENETVLEAIGSPSALAIDPVSGEDIYVAGSGGVLELARDAESGLLSVLEGAKGETACIESGASGECEQKNAPGLAPPTASPSAPMKRPST